MIINVLIATIDAGVGKVEEILLEPRTGVRYIVSHQVTDQQFRNVPGALKRSDVVVGQIEGRGLSGNRNNALKLADGDIALLADDDVRYRPEHFMTLLEAFDADGSMDVACFKIATPDGDFEYKDYAAKSYLLNDESHHYISSLEIAFRLDAIKSRGIVFDPRFGAGSKPVCYGEEAVFIHDCIRAGLKVKYIPAYVAEHSAKSTIKNISEYATEKNIFKGAYDARRFGWLAFPAALFGVLRLWPALREEGKNPLQYLKERLRGAWYIYRYLSGVSGGRGC